MTGEVEKFSYRVGPQATVMAAILALLSFALRDLSITAALVVGSAVDIGSFALIVFFSRRLTAKLQLYPALAMAALFEVRVFMKFLLLYLALAFPAMFNIWAMVVGVLIVETMIVLAGIPRAFDQSRWPGETGRTSEVGHT